MGDIDNFKEINDKYGHYTGDTVLKEISQLMKNNLRETDHLGRYGGEEFLIISPNTDLMGAYEQAERIRRRFNNFNFTNDIKITISFGVTSYQKNELVI